MRVFKKEREINMKKRILAAFLICMVLAFLTACGSEEKGKSTTGTSAPTDEQNQENQEFRLLSERWSSLR